MITKAQPVPERLPHKTAVLFFITSLLVCTFAFIITPATYGMNVDTGQVRVLDQATTGKKGGGPAKWLLKPDAKVPHLSPLRRKNRFADSADIQLISSVRVPNMFSYAVVQQPENDPYYVSSSSKLVTEFGMARQYNNIGLIAHNNLAGSLFKDLTLGQEIYITHQDSHADRYIVSAIYRFQALEPDKVESRFKNLDSGQILDASELFNQMYTGAPHLTFQTCIEALGNPSWGRLFVIAVPAPKNAD